MGIGDWGLGIGDWGFGPKTKTQNPKPKKNYDNNFNKFLLIIKKLLVFDNN